ncbi:MAG: hypothetical protein JWR35_3122 [Marmoricola sp.]|nr:hypothetical protein [Marmoricola sp.]
MTPLEHTRAWAADVVRSGLLSPAEALSEISGVIAVDHPDLPADATALGWIASVADEWRLTAATWPAVTDHDRLENAFAGLGARGIVVLQGCADHWSAKALLDDASERPRGIAWFTASDVWHAIDAGMLEVNLWHGTTANAAPGDALLDEAIEAFADAGLTACFDEGRIEVAAHWQRRPLA